MPKTDKLAKLPFVVSFFLFILSCLILYACLYSFFQKNEKFKLSVLLNNTKEILEQQLISLVLNDVDKTFSSLNHKKEQQQHNSQEFLPSVTVSDQNTLIINNLNFKLTFDSQQLKDLIAKILPAHVSYEVLINDQVLANRNTKSQQYLNLSSVIKVSDLIYLSMHLGMDKNSNYYQKKLNRFHRNYFVLIFFVLLINVFFLSLYFFVKSKLNVDKKNSARLAKQSELKVKALLAKINVYQKLDSLSVDLKNDTTTSINQINAVELAKDLEDYFNINDAKVSIHFNINVEYLYAFCSKANLYQLIFSFVHFLIMFMKGQSNEQKPLLIVFSEDKISLRFECFALDRQRMIHLAESVLDPINSSFFVGCNLLFELLDNYNCVCEFSLINAFTNKIEITLYNQQNEQVLNNAKIIKFTK